MNKLKKKSISPWFWIPSLYYAEGLPYIIAMTVSVIMYKTLGVSNTQIAFWTSLLYLPWTIKPIWSPLIDIYLTKRKWITSMQFLLGIFLAGIAFTLGFSWFFTGSLILLGLIAFFSATHDIACDGFYMLGLDEHNQTWFVGIRSTFYRFAMLTGQGLLIILAGYIESHTGLSEVTLEINGVKQSNQIESVIAEQLEIDEKPGALEIIVVPKKAEIPLNQKNISGIDSTNIYIYLSKAPENERSIIVNFGRKSGSKDFSLITPGRISFDKTNWNKPVRQTIKIDQRLKEPAVALFKANSGNTAFGWSITFLLVAALFIVFFLYHKSILPYPKNDFGQNRDTIWKSVIEVFKSFFMKKNIIAAIAFLLLYRLAEAQLVKMASPFLLDSFESGGMALTTGQVGFVYGTIGLIALIIGGVLGGFAAARYGLKKWIWWMAIAINLPNAVYVYLAYVLPDSFFTINLCVAIEQFGYGFGFTGYMLFMIYLSEGKFKTSHFAITTSFMALGMMIPGMISGFIQELLGYKLFFMWILIATIPSFIALKFIKIDPDFGKKKK
jgi:PAT family beta-lactamase induction signal transducer AmpG